MPCLLAERIDSRGDSAVGVDVVILEHCRVSQIVAVVSAASDCNRILLERTESRQGLAGIRNAGVGSLDELHALVGVGGNAAHVLEDIQRSTLCLEHKTGVTAEFRDDIAVLHLVAVLEMALDLHFRIEYREYAQGYLKSAQDAVRLGHEVRGGNAVLRDKQVGGAVDIVDVLSQRCLNNVVNVKR